MKQVLAVALIGGALLLGACDRPAATPGPGNPTTPAAAATTSDVDSLLNDVDRQLSSDDQSPADQD